MWLFRFIMFVCFGVVYCSEYVLDTDECMLYSRKDSILINLLSAHAESSDLLANYVAHFSFCPKKNKICPKGSFICLVDKRQDSKILDIGSSIIDIMPDGEQIIRLESPIGSGIVYIMCRENEYELPIFDTLEKTDRGTFTYSIKWMSKEGCPLKHYKAYDSCVLYTEENSYDLRPLQTTSEYVVKSGPFTYFINFCKGVSIKGCYGSPICSVNKGSDPKDIARKEGSTLQFISSRGLTLTYRNYVGGKTVMDFKCSENLEPKIEYIEENESEILFNVKTSIVCPVNKIDCMVKDDTNFSYDLSRLEFLNRNHNLLLNGGNKILFNICGPLKYIPNVLCSGGKYVACMINNLNKTMALASETDIKVLAPGQILYTISGNMTDTSGPPFSLKILLKCSNKISSHPYIKKTNSNIYDIVLETYIACPSKTMKGSDCKANNLFRDTEVDVSPLRRDHDYQITIRNETYRINICGNLMKSCNNTPDAAICYKNNKLNSEVPIGIVGSSQLIFVDGEYIFVLEGHPCNDKVTKSKITINLKCEYSENGRNNFYPEFINKVKECEFYFLWKTDLICKDPVTSDCSINHNGNIYDLTPLKNLKDNYNVRFDNTSDIVFNVCHSVISGVRVQCPSFSGACLVNRHIDYNLSNEKKRNTIIGMVPVHKPLEFLNGTLQLTYRNGGVCNTGTGGSIRTVIHFECDSTAVNTEPVFLGIEDCTYVLKWTTRVACPLLNNSEPLIEEIYRAHEEDCAAVDIRANKKYDISSLKGKNWSVKNKDIILGICSPVENLNCSTNSGACLKTENGYESLGYYNADLVFEENSLYLLYKSRGFKQVFIEFVCSSVDLGPEFIKEIDNITYISWRTLLACDEEAKTACCDKIENLCNFYNKTYLVAIGENQSVLLSLCRPAVPKMGFQCTNSSSSCIGTKSENGSYKNEQSLGKIYEEPVIAEDRSVFVSYTQGSVCDKDASLNYSTRIQFICDKSKYNDYLKFVNITDKCQYNFIWKTNILCDYTEEKKCLLSLNSSANMKQYLTDSAMNGQKGKYLLNICATSQKCGAHICKFTAGKWEPFAVWNNTVVSNSKISINYKSFRNKPEYGKCGATVRMLDCQEKDSRGPVLDKETDCFLEIKVFRHKEQSCMQPEGNSSKHDILPHREDINNIDIRTRTDTKRKNKQSSSTGWFIGAGFVIIILVIVGAYFFNKIRPHFNSNAIQRFIPRYRRLGRNRSTYSSVIFEEYNEDESVDLVIFSKRH